MTPRPTMKRLRDAPLGQPLDLRGLKDFNPEDAQGGMAMDPRPLKIRRRARPKAPKCDQPDEGNVPEPRLKRQTLDYRRPVNQDSYYAISKVKWELLVKNDDKGALRKYTHVGRIMEGDGKQASSPCAGCVKGHTECWVYKDEVQQEPGMGGTQCARCRYKQHGCSLAKAAKTEETRETHPGGEWVRREEYEALEAKYAQLRRDMDEFEEQTNARLAYLEGKLSE